MSDIIHYNGKPLSTSDNRAEAIIYNGSTVKNTLDDLENTYIDSAIVNTTYITQSATAVRFCRIGKIIFVFYTFTVTTEIPAGTPIAFITGLPLPANQFWVTLMGDTGSNQNNSTVMFSANGSIGTLYRKVPVGMYTGCFMYVSK